MKNPRAHGPQHNTIQNEVLEIGSRLHKSPDDLLINSAFTAELNNQLALFDDLNQVDLAHTLVMAESSLIPQQEAVQLLSALIALGQTQDYTASAELGDLYTNREAWLLRHTLAAQWLGAGRARREAINTAYCLTQRNALLRLSDALIVLGTMLSTVSLQYSNALMPDYTYLQKSQPTSFGHYLSGFIFPLTRDLTRLQSLYSRLNNCPAGCGSSNGSRLPQNRDRISQLLGFNNIVAHARDAMWQADMQIELMAMLTMINVNLGRLAEDMQIFSTDEFGILKLDDRHARASKIMPQKKNPYALTHIRGLANTMIGLLSSCTALNITSSGQPDNRITLYGLVPKALTDTRHAVCLMADVIKHMKFNITRGELLIQNSFAMASDLAEVLTMQTPLSFRQAHKLVAGLVTQHNSQGNFSQLTAQEINAAAQELFDLHINFSASLLHMSLNPDQALQARQQPGGTAVAQIEHMLQASNIELQAQADWSKQQQQSIQSAEQQLQHNVQNFISSRRKQ